MVAIPFKLLDGRTFMVEVDPSFTIGQVKAQVEANNGVPASKQTMIFAGKRLQDTATIVDLGIVSETAVMLVIPPGTPIRLGGAPPPAESKRPEPAPVATVAAHVATPVGASSTKAPVATPVSKASSAVPTVPPPVVRPMGMGAGAGGAGAGATPPASSAAPATPAADAVVGLNVKELSGRIRTVHVPLSMPFKEIKLKLQEVTGIPAVQQRLVFRGALVDDNMSPGYYNCNNDTCMHLVRHVTRDVLSDTITKEGLKANCMFCHKAGAQFEPRPLCANCVSRGANPESVMMTAGDVTIGTTTWRDLLGVRVQCFNCNKEGLAAIGFLCMQQTDGHNCVSRRERRLQNTYKGTGEAELQETMNRHFGYAHAGGMQDTV